MIGLQTNWLDLVGKSIYRIENAGTANLLHVFFTDGTEELWLAGTILASRIKVVEADKAVVDGRHAAGHGVDDPFVVPSLPDMIERQKAQDAVWADYMPD